jgi:hypothetical protein
VESEIPLDQYESCRIRPAERIEGILLVPGSHSGLSSPHSNNSYNPMKMDEERREDERGG